MRAPYVACCMALLVALSCSPATCEELDEEAVKVPLEAAELPVDSVTVFADRAEVIRPVSHKLEEAGLVDITIRGLPRRHLIANSLRVDIVGEDAASKAEVGSGGSISNTAAAVTILGVTHDTATRAVDEKQRGSEAVEAALEAIAALEAGLAQVQSEKSRLDSERSLVLSFGKQRFSAPVEGKWEDVDTLQGMLQWTQGRLAEVDAAALANAARQGELQKKLRRARAELDDATRSSSRPEEDVQRVLDVTVSLDVRRAGELRLNLKYLVKGAWWSPSYDVRFDTETGEMSVVYFAEVGQETGEDWPRTSLKLSTAAPTSSGSAPALKGAKVKWAEVWHGDYVMSSGSSNGVQNDRQRVTQDRGESERDLKRKWRKQAMRSVAEAEMRFAGSHVGASAGSSGSSGGAAASQGGGGTTTFTIAKRTTVPSTGRPRRVAIQMLTFNASLSYEVVPDEASSAFTKASADNTAGVPLLASDDVSIFVDGSFVARSSVEHVSPGQTFSVYLGVDADVSVSVKRPHTKHSKATAAFGLGAKSEIHEYSGMTHVTNLKDRSIHLVVGQSLPESVDERIVVEVTQPSALEMKRYKGVGESCGKAKGTCVCLSGDEACFRHGVAVVDSPKRLERHILLQPGQKADLPFNYRIQWPSDDAHHRHGIHIETSDAQ